MISWQGQYVLTPDARRGFVPMQAGLSSGLALYMYEPSTSGAVKLKKPSSTPVRRADAGGLAAAVAILRNGGLVAFPTETVYGLGADATSGEAVAKIYAAKGRPQFNPLIAHVESLQAARRQGEFSPAALALAAAFWPGPLTLVVPSIGTVCLLARAGLDSIGLRVPGSSVARALIGAFGRPLAGPSANLSGHVSPVSAAHVQSDLSGRIDMILDGGLCAIGVESTIVACLPGGPRLLRPGGVPVEALETVLAARIALAQSARIIAPGQMASHYAPQAKLRLDAELLEPGEAALDFGGRLSAHAPRNALVLDLSSGGDLREAAANLFGHLRRLDQLGVDGIAAAPVPRHGLGAAINDRLARAAAPR